MRGRLDGGPVGSGAVRQARRGVLAVPPLVLVPLVVGAQSTVTTTLDTTVATVGDRITLTVSVDLPEGARVAWPDSLDLSPFEVLDARTGASTAVFTLTAFDLGRLEIPSFGVEVVGADGAREVATTDAWDVEITSVGVDESGEIRDIRGPLSIPTGALRMMLVALGPLLLIALLYTIARRLRSRDGGSAAPDLAPLERPAHEIALRGLAELEASDLLDRGLVKEYHIQVSTILRAYVERRFRVEALEMTTREVLGGLELAGAESALREGLGAFLDQCDLVKFAKVRPRADVSRQVLELGRRLVLRSAPRPGPPEPVHDDVGASPGNDASRRESRESHEAPATVSAEDA